MRCANVFNEAARLAPRHGSRPRRRDSALDLPYAAPADRAKQIISDVPFSVPPVFCLGESTYYENPDPNVWTNPSTTGVSFHPGAAVCMRSSMQLPNGAGQQCCYDDGGKLITSGKGAGTVDLSAPNTWGGFFSHQIDDVQAFNYASYLDGATTMQSDTFVQLYWEVRPQNKGVSSEGNPCSGNP